MCAHFGFSSLSRDNRLAELRCCEFPRIKGGKHFDITETWYVDMMAQLGQPIVPAQA